MRARAQPLLVALQSILVAGGLGVAACVGAVLVALTTAQGCTGYFCGLEWFVGGLLVGAGLGLVVYLAVGIRFITARLEQGRRGAAISMHLLAPVMVPLALAILANVVDAIS